MTKVSITTGGHTVEVEQDGASATELARLARKLWRQTRDPRDDARADQVGFAAVPSMERAS